MLRRREHLAFWLPLGLVLLLFLVIPVISGLPLVVLVAAAYRALERFSLRAGETEL